MRLSQERGWRKAVCKYLQGEMASKGQLERALLNVGTSLRVGDTAAATGRGVAGGQHVAAPPLPPRAVAASQLLAPAAVPAVHESPATAIGGAGQQGSIAADWRRRQAAALAAFDELSGLRREGVSRAAC